MNQLSLNPMSVIEKTVSAAFLDDKSAQFLVVRVRHRSPIFAKELVDLIVREINELQRYNDIREADASLEYLSKSTNSNTTNKYKIINQFTYRESSQNKNVCKCKVRLCC